MNNLLLYSNPNLIQQFIWQSITTLPKESIEEILNFVVYVRKKNHQPELFNLEYEILNEELHQNSQYETSHLEKEFDNYKTEFPHE